MDTMIRRSLALALLGACTGFHPVTTPPRPRLVAPLSTATVSTPRPTLRFSLPPTLHAPAVELCASRACDGTRVSATIDATGTTAVPDGDLAPGLWYWRVRAAGTASDVWQLYVQPTGGVETAWGSQLDLNGDGFAELAVGAPQANGGNGRVYIYQGGPNGPDPAHPTVLDGPTGSGQFGESIAAVDFDGDGFVDLAVGAVASGTVSIYRGGPGGVQAPPAYLLNNTDQTGAQQLGFSLDFAGDVNGDGYGDIVAGAPTTLLASGNLSGAAYLFFGGPSSSLQALKPADRNKWSIGYAVTGGGDFDGDGFSDLLVGAPGANTSAGLGFVYSGRNFGVTDVPQTLDPTAPQLAHFGSAVAQLGDVDGDGRADFAVGAPQMGAGRVYRYSGGSSASPATLDGPDQSGSLFGLTLAGADLDGDGRNDLLVAATCAPGNDRSCPGAVYLVVGSTLTAVRAPSGVVSYGVALSTGDHDGDGRADFAVGASEANGQLGRVDWYHDAIPSAAPRVLNGVDVGGRFGFSLR
jgi:hypothetical protein